MLTRALFVALLMIPFFGASAQAASHRGTWNADLTCGGIPEEVCSSPYATRSAFGDDYRPLARAASCDSSPLPSLSRQAPVFGGTGGIVLVGLAEKNIGARLNLGLDSAWVTSGVWMGDRSLLLADARSQTLLRVSVTGERLPPPILQAPVREIRPRPGGFIVKVASDEFLVLDRELRPLDTVRLTFTESDGVRAVFTWMPLAGSLFGFADIQEGGHWTSGWVNIPLVSHRSYKLLRSVPLEGLERKLYPLGLPFLAVLGADSYFLATVDGSIRLFTISPEKTGDRVRELPKGPILTIPNIPSGIGRKAAVARYHSLERLAAPVGLYGHKGMLFLLTRRPSNLATEWRLHRLDPRSGAELGSRLLPTSAAHLLVIPGDAHWAVIEKGPVRALADQDVLSVLLLSSKWIERAKELDGEPRLRLAVNPLKGVSAGR